jgi:hypothetical protein
MAGDVASLAAEMTPYVSAAVGAARVSTGGYSGSMVRITSRRNLTLTTTRQRRPRHRERCELLKVRLDGGPRPVLLRDPRHEHLPLPIVSTATAVLSRPPATGS